MTRKSKFFSAISIAAAGVLMITTTAYQSKAADSTAMGDGYAGTQLADVTTVSHGIFNYDDPSAVGEEIKLSGDDITNLATAVNALSAQVFEVGAKAKAADMLLDSSAAAAVDRLTESLSSSGGGGGASGGNIHGELLKTDWGWVNIDQSFVLQGDGLVNTFANTGYIGYGYGYGYTKNPNGGTNYSQPTEVKDANYGVVHVTDGPSRYIVWEGNLTAEQLKTTAAKGRLAYAFNDNGLTGTTVTGSVTGIATLNAYVIGKGGGFSPLYNYERKRSSNSSTYYNSYYYYTFAPLVD